MQFFFVSKCSNVDSSTAAAAAAAADDDNDDDNDDSDDENDTESDDVDARRSSPLLPFVAFIAAEYLATSSRTVSVCPFAAACKSLSDSIAV